MIEDDDCDREYNSVDRFSFGRTGGVPLYAIPEGWVVVPKALTPHMGHAGEAVLDDDGSMQAIWGAMLSAAPETPND
jgi:hypothetical protein